MCLTSASGQRHESFEGFVSGIRANAVKGEVFYQRDDGKFNLEAGHKLQEGDFIKTESNSYAELLLQPGNYLRVGAESELQIFSDPNDKMRLKLNSRRDQSRDSGERRRRVRSSTSRLARFMS